MFNEQNKMQDQRLNHERSIIRVIAAGIGLLILTGLLVSQIVKLQVVEHEHYTTRSKNNRMRVLPVAPTRGEIFDRNGQKLAENRSEFKLEIIPQKVEDIEALLSELQRHVSLTERELKRFRASWKPGSRSEKPLLVKLRLNDTERAKVAAHRPKLPGVRVSGYFSRHYPFGESTAHVVGYVGRISQADLESVPDFNYQGTVHFGKTGIERSYETLLHGETGLQQVETSASGRVMRLIRETPPKPGKHLQLTIDMQLQQMAEKALGAHNGAIVAIDPRNGEILAFASMPHFDPNAFVHGISHKAFNKINTDHRRPMFNRALKGQYPPGSTLKPMVSLAALEHGIVDKRTRILCTGSYQLESNDHKYRDWNRKGHGRVNMNHAIAQSCDVYFYDTGFNLGINRIHDYLSQFGIGKRTGIDLLGERKGLLPSREWKRGAKGKAWFQGETLITAIGQGFMLSTPLQLAQATAIMANQGKVIQPHLVKGSALTNGNEQSQDFTISKRHYRDVLKAMENVTSSHYGTARSIGEHLDYVIAGKTGTAQVYGLSQEEDEDATQDDIPAHLRDHALFISFAPSKNPVIALAVVVEHGGSGGAVAAPIAREVTHFWLKKQGISKVSGQPPADEDEAP